MLTFTFLLTTLPPALENAQAVRKKKRVIMEPQFLGMFVQIILAIHYLHHEHNILHRDLKSKNIFLGGHRQIEAGVVVPVVKVGDFGIAKMLDGSMELAKTQIGTVLFPLLQLASLGNQPVHRPTHRPRSVRHP
jgi:serine/threonine protein kinase